MSKIYLCLSDNHFLSIFFESADLSADPFPSSSQASSNRDLYLQSIPALVSTQSHNLTLKMRLS